MDSNVFLKLLSSLRTEQFILISKYKIVYFIPYINLYKYKIVYVIPYIKLPLVINTITIKEAINKEVITFLNR